MPKKISLTLITAAMFGSLPAMAAGGSTNAILNVNNQVNLDYTNTKVDYTETGGAYGSMGGTLDTESGNVGGYQIGLSSMRNWLFGNDYLYAEYNHSKGDTNYVGQSINNTVNTYGSITGTDGAELENYFARYGKGFALGQTMMVTPYFELGHHSWTRSVNAGEVYANRWYGIGVLAQYAASQQLVFSLNGMVGNNYGSNIDVAGTFAGSLQNSSITRIGGSLDYAMTSNWHANLGIEYTSFKYGYSGMYPVTINNTLYGAYEPSSTTNYTVAKIGIGYSF